MNITQEYHFEVYQYDRYCIFTSDTKQNGMGLSNHIVM